MFERLKKLPLVRPAYHYLLALIGALICGFPSKKLVVIGVTGTKGKTTVLELMNAVLEEAGKKTALLSSVAVKVGAERAKNPTENTMPGRFFIQKFLRRAVQSGCEYALVEVSSEGVALSRHRFIKWNAAFLIDLHPEHIESHGSFEKYRAAKLSFLDYAARQGAAVFINKNDMNAEFFVSALAGRAVTSYERENCPPKFFEKLPEFFASDFNKDNAAAALALARHLHIDDETTRRALERFAGLSGRMEFVQKSPFAVVVDYAHTPDSLEAVYKNLKPSSKNSRLICVLGSAGGGRDKWKRPQMGRIAANYCDAIVLTDEDSYDEDPQKIMREIENGIRDNPKFAHGLSGMVWKIEDRGKAITHAISLAQKGDVVAITGKGSEGSIHLARGKKIPWSDRDEAVKALQEAK